MKRKITLSTLKELSDANSHDDLANYFGGGSGTRNDPYSFLEYMTLGWAFIGYRQRTKDCTGAERSV